jgi:hypothetical protein
MDQGHRTTTDRNEGDAGRQANTVVSAQGQTGSDSAQCKTGSITSKHDDLVKAVMMHGERFASHTDEHRLIKSVVEELAGHQRILFYMEANRNEMASILDKRGVEIAALTDQVKLARLALRG